MLSDVKTASSQALLSGVRQLPAKALLSGMKWIRAGMNDPQIHRVFGIAVQSAKYKGDESIIPLDMQIHVNLGRCEQQN